MTTSGVDGTKSSQLQDQIEEAGSAHEDEEWQKTAQSKLLSLNTSNADLIDFVMESLEGEDVSPAKQMAMQLLISQRTSMITAISNCMRAVFDGANSIIKNIRA